MSEKRLPGSTIIAQITFLEPDGTTPFNLSQNSNYIVYAFVLPNRIIAQFSRETIEGYSDLEIIDANDGIAQITIPGNLTKGLKEQQIYAVAYGQADDSGNPVPFGTINGAMYELCYITQSPVTTPPLV